MAEEDVRMRQLRGVWPDSAAKRRIAVTWSLVEINNTVERFRSYDFLPYDTNN